MGFLKPHSSIIVYAMAVICHTMSQTAAFVSTSGAIHYYHTRSSHDPLIVDSSSSAVHLPSLHATPSDEESTTQASSSSSSILQSDNNDMQTIGTQMILAAAKEAGATEPMIHIDWKADRIIVTVDVNADESYSEDDYDDDGMMDEEEEWEDVLYDVDDGDDYIVDEEELASLDFDDLINDENEEDDAPSSNAISVPRIARQINEYLSKDGEGSIGHTIAELHEIEVTTPEFDNVLRGRLFQVYKGFDVIVDHWEVKKQKKKTTKGSSETSTGNDDDDDDVQKKRVKTEGKLVERDMEKNVTIINVKGRNRKINNYKGRNKKSRMI